MEFPDTLIFFGAGATASLGLPTTEEQEKFLKLLIGEGSIKKRLQGCDDLSAEALDDFDRTLKLLFDGDGKETELGAHQVREKAIKDFENDIKKVLENGHLFNKNLSVHLTRYFNTYVFPYYDWLAFKSIYRDFTETSETVRLNHILSVISKALIENIALPTRELFSKDESSIFPVYVNYKQRLEGALRIYKLLIFKLFKHKIRKTNNKNFNLYEKFFKEAFDISINFRSLETGKKSAISREGFISPLSYATLNWDPVVPFYLVKQAKSVNNELAYKGKRVYVSYGGPFLVFKMTGREEVGYIVDEDAAFFTNLITYERKKSSLLTRLVKFFPAHGLMNLRVCPRCQSAFIIFPNDVSSLSPENLWDIFLLDPLPSKEDLKIIKNRHFNSYTISNSWLPSQIMCPICRSPTFFFDTFILIQSILKLEDSPLMKKVYYEYAERASKAEHIIFIGYSFPSDDVTHLLSLLAMKTGVNKERKITLILKKRGYNKKIWYSLKDINNIDKTTMNSLENVGLIAKRKNIRISFLGFPLIINMTNVKDILLWKKP